MFIDVFGGNCWGLYIIMVVLVKWIDGFIMKFNRLIERWLLCYFSKKGYIIWEENWLFDILKCIGCGVLF